MPPENVKKKHRWLIYPSLLLAGSVQVAGAAEPDTGNSLATASPAEALEEEIRWLQEETFVTTATKTKENRSKSGASVSVITDTDLRDMGARSLMDALKRVPGIGITQSNIGMNEIEVRGVKTSFSEKVLFLINGHPTNNSLVNGGAFSAYDNVIIDDIKRVEIVRGPGSALYGANAFVAVINVITRQASDVNGTQLSIAGGSDDSTQFNALYGGTVGGVDIVANANVLDTNGMDAQVASDQATALDALFGTDTSMAPGPVDDWQRRYDFSLSVAWQNYSLQGKYVKRNAGSFVGVANALNDESEQAYIDYFLEFAYVRPISQDINVSAKVYFDYFEFDNYWEIFPEGFGGVFPDGYLARSPATNERVGGDLFVEYNLHNQHKLLAGVTLEHQRQTDVSFSTNFNPLTGAPLDEYQDVSGLWNWNGDHDRHIWAAYAQDIWDINEQLRLILGARYDHYSDFGGSFNPRTSLSWSFIDDFTLVLAYGSAFRAPTFAELYNINNPAILGNPGVQPEQIDTLELGLNAALGKRTHARATVFHNKIEDLIGVQSSADAVAVSGNVGKLSVNGLELELESRLSDGSSLMFNYTFQDPENDLTDTDIPEVPRHKANLAFTYRHSRFVNLYTGLFYKGEVSRATGDLRHDIPDYVTVDMSLTWKDYIKHLEVKASVYNLLDEDYVDPSPAGVMESDYPTPGRNFMVNLSYKI
jgi:iron complex outermembrane receptor protein